MTIAKEPRTLQKDKGLGPVALSFLLALAGAAAIFIPFLVVDKGFFLYAGDYNQQQVPFYYYLQGFIKEGGGTWSWATDLGSSAVTSYSFYNLGSPFMWLTLLLPQRWMPYLMGPLFILKFACLAGACALFLQRYAKTRNMVVIVSVVYAFCGFNTYNIFFNHMHEPAILFPIMLWAMDGFVYENKRGWFALSVGLALFNSYFFFSGNVVFILIYFVVKLALGEYTITPGRFAQLGLEAVLGVGLGMVLFLPSVINLMGNSRTTEFANGMRTLVYSSGQQYWNILTSFFIPQDSPWAPNIFTEGSIKWTSMSAYLPVLSVAGVAAYWKGRKRSSIKWMLGISLICALIPFLNSAFYAFNSSYYCRWYYMPILFMCFASLRSLEDEDIDLKFGAKVALIGTALFAVVGLIPTKEDEKWKLGFTQYPEKFWILFLLALAAVVVFYILVSRYRGSIRFAPLLLSAVMGFSVFYTVVHVSLGKFTQYERDTVYKYHTYDASEYLDLPEGYFYRLDVYYKSDADTPKFDNIGLWLNKSSMQSFNSVITTATMDFYSSLGLTRDVRSNPNPRLYALRGLLSAEFTLVPQEYQADFEENIEQYGWTLYQTAGAYAVYRNENYIPLGFTYDEYLNMAYLEDMSNKDARTNLLVRAIGLDWEQIERYGYLFAEEEALRQIVETNDDGEEKVRYEYDLVSYDTYVEDAADRRMSASHASSYDSTGFRVNIQMERENLVFFSVPYDEGFTATVNGQNAEILNVSGGMMAVLAPAGSNEIVFVYKTPGLNMGAAVSIASVIVLVAYVVLYKKYTNKPKKKVK